MTDSSIWSHQLWSRTQYRAASFLPRNVKNWNNLQKETVEARTIDICVNGLQNFRLDSPPPSPSCPPPVLFIPITHHHPTALLTHHPSPTLFTNPVPSYRPILPLPYPPHHLCLNCSETQSITQIYLLKTPVTGARTIKFDCGPSTLKKKKPGYLWADTDCTIHKPNQCGTFKVNNAHKWEYISPWVEWKYDLSF